MEKVRARCAQMDPELWFPLNEADPEQVAPAAALCAVCPLRERCLDWALGAGIDDGVWGGLSSPERRALKARQRAGRAA